MTPEPQLLFGICGLGFMGRQYYFHLDRHRHARVRAVCDRDPQRLAGDWSNGVGNLLVGRGQRVNLSAVKAFSSWEPLIEAPEIQAVAITLPTPMHAEIAVRALEAGKHVLCEKPMALTLEDCDRMIAAAKRTGQTLMIAQCIRFWPQYEEIKRHVDRGRLGLIRFASLRRLASPPAYSQGGWLLDGSQSGGALFDLHVHDVDFAHHLLGVPDRVSACGGRGPSGAIDHVLATYNYRDGRYAILEGGWMFTPPYPFEMAITVVGDEGTLDWSLRRGPDVDFHRGARVEKIAVSDETGWTRELDYFIDCLRHQKPVERCTPESSRTSIALALAEREAIQTGAAIEFPR